MTEHVTAEQLKQWVLDQLQSGPTRSTSAAELERAAKKLDAAARQFERDMTVKQVAPRRPE